LLPTYTSSTLEGCAPFNIALTNTTDLTDQCGTPVYEWVINYTPDFCGTTGQYNFINGTDGNSENPEIEFLNPGRYNIQLKGGIADLTVDFSFGPNNVCSGQSVSFTSIVTGDGPFDYEWAFGDGSFSTDENPNHIFQANPGCGSQDFNVELTVTDAKWRCRS